MQTTNRVTNQIAVNGAAELMVYGKYRDQGYTTEPVVLRAVGDDPIVRHLHLFNSHDGSAAFGALFTDTRLFCANQFGTITRGRSSETLLRHPHTAGVTRFAEQLATRIDLETGRFLTECEGPGPAALLPHHQGAHRSDPAPHLRRRTRQAHRRPARR